MQLTYPGFKTKCLTFSYDDAVVQDRKLVQMFRNYGLKATFNLNSGSLGTKQRITHFGFDVLFDKIDACEVKDLYRGMEVAAHGVLHKNLCSLTSEEIKTEMDGDRKALEALTGLPVAGMAYAGGCFDRRVAKELANLGFAFGRTIQDTLFSFGLPDDFLMWHPSCHDNDPHMAELIEAFLSDSGETMPLFYIWGHSFELDKNDKDRWSQMDTTCRKLSGHDSVWYATNGEIVRYVTALRSLKITESTVENPSNVDIYAIVDGQKMVFPANAKTALPSKVQILLPRKIYLQKKAGEEWNLYFRNFIEGLRPGDEIKVYCACGAQYEDFWRVLPEELEPGEYPLTLEVNRAVTATTTLVVNEDTSDHCETLLCIGDSMTRAATYVTQTAMNVRGLETLGSRRPHAEPFVRCEGWPGYSMPTLFGEHRDNDLGLDSLFMFPKSVSAEHYWGNTRFWHNVRTQPESGFFEGLEEFGDLYTEEGYPAHPVAGDTVYTPKIGLQQYSTDDKWIPFTDEIVFDFAKYARRYLHGVVPDYVSVLMGANDFQVCGAPYQTYEEKIVIFQEKLEAMFASIRAYAPNVKLIVNLPVIGASQDAWGMRMKCLGSARQYDHNVRRAVADLLTTWDTPEMEARGIVISPMLLGIDPVYGFDSEPTRANKYSPVRVDLHINWVHPNRAGYCQMGDTLAATIVALRNQKEKERNL